MNWYTKVIKKYATFDGRARRAEYWYFALFNFLISFAIGFLEALINPEGIGVWGLIYSLFIFLPSLAVSIRRMHDTGRSGWWILIGIIPIIGWIIYLVFVCQDSEPGDNQYGRNPKSAY